MTGGKISDLIKLRGILRSIPCLCGRRRCERCVSLDAVEALLIEQNGSVHK